jgi:predicted RND superfamily exporter protein
MLSSDMIDTMQRDGPRATAAALFVVLVVVALAFRSVRLSAIAVGALLLGVVVMLGLGAWAGQRLNFSNFVVLPLTFGIAADYSLNVLQRYQSDGDLNAAIGDTGGAVALCSAATVIGFGSLLLAQNGALFSFGALAVSGELTGLATAALVLPAFLAWRAKATASSQP